MGIEFTPPDCRSLAIVLKHRSEIIPRSNFLWFSLTCIQFNIFKQAFKALYNAVPSSPSRLSTFRLSQHPKPIQTQLLPHVHKPHIATLWCLSSFSSLCSRCTFLFLINPTHTCFPSAGWNGTLCKKTYWIYPTGSNLSSHPSLLYTVLSVFEPIFIYLSSPYTSFFPI